MPLSLALRLQAVAELLLVALQLGIGVQGIIKHARLLAHRLPDGQGAANRDQIRTGLRALADLQYARQGAARDTDLDALLTPELTGKVVSLATNLLHPEAAGSRNNAAKVIAAFAAANVLPTGRLGMMSELVAALDASTDSMQVELALAFTHPVTHNQVAEQTMQELRSSKFLSGPHPDNAMGKAAADLAAILKASEPRMPGPAESPMPILEASHPQIDSAEPSASHNRRLSQPSRQHSQ